MLPFVSGEDLKAFNQNIEELSVKVERLVAENANLIQMVKDRDRLLDKIVESKAVYRKLVPVMVNGVEEMRMSYRSYPWPEDR